MAAPTLNFENGAYAFFITLRAERSRRSRIAADTFVAFIFRLAAIVTRDQASTVEIFVRVSTSARRCLLHDCVCVLLQIRGHIIRSCLSIQYQSIRYQS